MQSKCLGLQIDPSGELSRQLIRQALDLGINYIDTAVACGTEEVIAGAIKRKDVIISTKTLWKLAHRAGWATVAERNMKHLDESLKLFGGYIDIFFMHYITSPAVLAKAVDARAEPLLKAKQAGKIRYIGVTEGYPGDVNAAMASAAAKMSLFDVLMVAEHGDQMRDIKRLGKGTVLMGANKSRPAKTPSSYADARERTGADVALMSTSSVKHLRENVAAFPLVSGRRRYPATAFSLGA
jgi:aryl-alcohol dehydrogenase-like predicted oxidoreductase